MTPQVSEAAKLREMDADELKAYIAEQRRKPRTRSRVEQIRYAYIQLEQLQGSKLLKDGRI